MSRNGKNERRTVRCAIYTRKSTEEGLQQEFNSLDAQREAGEAYIASQKAEGWVCRPDRYDDGGFTGGNVDRPGVQQLLADIEAGKVDCVVVYKVDRLSRSLMDFARMMETFDKQSVSFVSVTQQFNTTHSMGRLTLNILLSFAQFEREIISERTRDKIAASRRKGKWTGGRPILGYDVAANPRGNKLAVNETEAAQVREIFDLYLQKQSLLRTVTELNSRGWTTKRWTARNGREQGGRLFGKPGLLHLLTNVLYIGRVRYHEETFDGEHDGILDRELFDRVGAMLRSNGRTGGMQPTWLGPGMWQGSGYSSLPGPGPTCTQIANAMNSPTTKIRSRSNIQSSLDVSSPNPIPGPGPAIRDPAIQTAQVRMVTSTPNRMSWNT